MQIPETNLFYIPDYQTLISLLISCLIWTLLYNILMQIPIPKYKASNAASGKPIELTETEKVDVYNRVISFIHGFTFCILCIIDVSYYGIPFGSQNTELQKNIMIMSFGYFVFNSLSMTYYNLLAPSMAFHHIIVCIVYYASLSFNVSGSEIAYGAYITEISNSPMHFRLFLRTFGLRHSKAYECSEIIYIILYTYFRCFNGTIFVLNLFLNPSIHLIVKAVALGIYLQSVFFICKMVPILKARYQEYSERKSSKISLHWFSLNVKVQSLSYYAKSAKKEGIP